MEVPMAPPFLGHSSGDRRLTRARGCSRHVRERSMLVCPFTYGDYVH